MNIKQIKFTLQALMYLSLLQPYYTMAVQPLWYQTYFRKLNPYRYTRHCALIHTAQKIRGNTLLAYYRLTHKKINLDKAISAIQGKLKEFEPWLITLEQKALTAIKEKHGMSDNIWQKYLTNLQDIKDNFKQGLRSIHPDAIHDPAVPADILNILTTLLEQNNINPASISIKMITDLEEIAANPNALMQVQLFIWPIPTHGSTVPTDYIPACIEIFPNLKNQSLNEKISFCAHEIEHLIQQHSITDIVLTEYLTHYYSIDEATVKQTQEYHTLCQIHEAQAEILSAIKNPKIADCHTMMRKKYFYPNHLYQEHFYHLSTIDMLWKINAWLEFFHSNGLIQKRNEWLIKIKKYGIFLKQLLT